jgi:oligopeptide/dipeptide ABC transporter ATP-binding protein
MEGGEIVSKPILQINHLKTHFFTGEVEIPSVDGVSLTLNEGETLGIVGESGSGKSVTSLSVMGLIELPGKVVSGEILYKSTNLLNLSYGEMRKIRGREITMIFQEPLTALNPVFTIGAQIQEIILNHKKISKAKAKKETLELLRKVKIPRPESVYRSYPHELSGGMRQRVMIAMAISCNPKVLIADEPTTALDVTIQAQILKIMKDIKEEGSSIMLITHDLGVIEEMADRVAVMYAGQIVEQCDVFTLFKSPKHPYTEGLLNSTPKLYNMGEKLESMEGSVPNPTSMPSGCRFHPRCPSAKQICSENTPDLIEINKAHIVRCLIYQDEFKHEWEKRGGDDGSYERQKRAIKN